MQKTWIDDIKMQKILDTTSRMQNLLYFETSSPKYLFSTTVQMYRVLYMRFWAHQMRFRRLIVLMSDG
jgi:hypothetical protein